jgi:hypothetical protein
MPNGAAYRDAGQRCRLVAGSIAREAAEHRASTVATQVAIGPIHDAIVEHLNAVHEHLLRSSDEFIRLAQLCLRRAEICDAYVRELEAHERLPWHVRLLTPNPAPPAPWAGR